MNSDRRFARARLRQGRPRQRGPVDSRTAGLRIAEERALAACLPQVATLDALGNANVERERWRSLPEPLARLVVARVAMAVGGLAYAPRGGPRGYPGQPSARHRLPQRQPLAAVSGGAGTGVTVVRERRHLPSVETSGGDVLWDGRFRMWMPEGRWRVRPLALADLESVRGSAVPDFPRGAAWWALPALDGVDELAAIPHMMYAVDKRASRCRVRFAPAQPACRGRCSV